MLLLLLLLLLLLQGKAVLPGNDEMLLFHGNVTGEGGAPGDPATNQCTRLQLSLSFVSESPIDDAISGRFYLV